MPSITTYAVDSTTGDEFRRLGQGFAKVVTSTTYTLLAADHGKHIFFQNSSAITVTVPSGLGTHFSCRIVQDSTGQVTVAAGSGVTLNAYSGWVKTAGQHAGATLINKGAELYTLFGQLTA